MNMYCMQLQEPCLVNINLCVRDEHVCVIVAQSANALKEYFKAANRLGRENGNIIETDFEKLKGFSTWVGPIAAGFNEKMPITHVFWVETQKVEEISSKSC